MAMASSLFLPNVYLRCIGCIFVIAFLSYHAQYFALSSRSGIEPSERAFRNEFPLVYRHVVDVENGYSLDPDSFVELLAVFGAILSTLIASGIVHHGLIFLAVTWIYHFLVVLGSSFYTFQWDSLLVETGFLTGVCFAPWRKLRIGRCGSGSGDGSGSGSGSGSGTTRVKNGQQQEEEEEDGDEGVELGSWPIRVLLFKLMFMSGVVKIQADCPTWQNLTALEYHFATQCLPGPLAWHAHQLHPFLLRLGVATTFVIEIPAAFLLISPFPSLRSVGAYMQILLQILILSTGSYNYFNLLTIALCLPCMMMRVGGTKSRGGGDDDDDDSASAGRSFLGARTCRAPQLASCALFLSWACWKMFDVERIEGYSSSADPERRRRRTMIGLKLAVTGEDCNLLAERAAPVALAFAMAFAMAAGVRDVIGKRRRRRKRRNDRLVSSLVHVLACCSCIVITAVPLVDLSPRRYRQSLWGLDPSTWRDLRVRSSGISHGYGLFRRMTGVGGQPQPRQSTDTTEHDGVPVGWAGLPPSIVARPEIILEVRMDGSDEWRELNFRWKPGAVDRRPMQAAPHQPRFDWRMWFAALGTIQHNPWLASFVEKMLAGCPTVLDLLDEPDLFNGSEKISGVRANLYHYDFTRLDTEWARRIPDVEIVDVDNGPLLFQYPDRVWKRTLHGQYLPPLEPGNQSLREFLRHAGYEPSVCVKGEGRCTGVGATARLPCEVASSLQIWKRQLWALLLVASLSCHVIGIHRMRSKRDKLKLE